MQSENYSITPLDATGSGGNVRMILSLVSRGEVRHITVHIRTTNPPAFFSIEDVRHVNGGDFCPEKPDRITGMFHALSRRGKRK